MIHFANDSNRSFLIGSLSLFSSLSEYIRWMEQHFYRGQRSLYFAGNCLLDLWFGESSIVEWATRRRYEKYDNANMIQLKLKNTCTRSIQIYCSILASNTLKSFSCWVFIIYWVVICVACVIIYELYEIWTRMWFEIIFLELHQSGRHFQRTNWKC